MGKSGDFTYASAAFEAAQEYNQDERTATQRAADKAKRAPVTTDYQRWKSDPSGLDFPGVDTPSASPEVLPKDLKQSQKPELSARAQNEAPAEPVPTTTRDLERQELSRTDISLAPDEAFEGVGSETSEAAFFGSGSRVDEQRRLESGDPPDIARGEDPFDMSTSGGALDGDARIESDAGSGETPAGVARRESERQAAQSEQETPGLQLLDSRIRASRGDELDTSDAKYGAEEKEELASLFK